MPGFQRVQPLGEGFIRGPARLLVAPITVAYPATIASVVNVKATDLAYQSEVQSIAITGSPAGGTFRLAFQGSATGNLAFNATSAAIQSALQALPGIGAGGATTTGGPLPTAVVVTFAGNNANAAQPLIQADSTALTGGTTPAVTVTRTTAGNGQWDPTPGSGFTELGSTRGGIRISRNNTETLIDVDQIQAALMAIPDEWELTVEAPLAETTLENIQIAWEGGAITTDTTQTPNERHLGLGSPLSYNNRRLVILHRKIVSPAAGRIRAHFFRSVTRSPVASTLEYMKTGAQATLATTFRCFSDASVADPAYSFGDLVDEVAFP